MNENHVGYLHREFRVNSAGECSELVISHQVSAAYDILTDAGYSPEKSAHVAATAQTHDMDPERIARKMAAFRRVLQEHEPQA